MAYSPDKVAEARAAFVYEALNLKAISRRYKIPISTVTRWKSSALKNGDDWDRARAAARMSSLGTEAVTATVLEDFMLLFQSTMNDIKDSKDVKPLEKAEVLSRISDAYSKTMNAVSKGNPKLDKLSFAADILRDLVQFIQTDYPQHAAAMEEVLLPFGESIGRRYG
ncbi:DUF1804 family protein [Nitrosomonas halophila]|uniref:Uncharacterized protein n=1 Tax=Nitrosomonas halophila TaxID=44576 RepID=A0A1H3FD57_9PROT|nr:DUF1804 family protein [Nitrosomonas halophila]SDX88825.1 Protein of unknown function [Nitrosomonas halophila]